MSVHSTAAQIDSTLKLAIVRVSEGDQDENGDEELPDIADAAADSEDEDLS